MEESLEHIRESAETRMRKNAFMLHNYIELERVEKDRAVFKLDIRPESCNPYGLIHGGAIYTLADTPPARRPTATGGITSHRPARSTSCATRPQGRCGPLLGSGTVESPRCSPLWTSPETAAGCWPRGSSPSSVWTRH